MNIPILGICFKVEHILAIITLINAIFVTFVVFNQYNLAKEKLKLDLFEKRFAVDKGGQEFLTKIMIDGKVNDLQIINEFRAKTQDAVFLFGDEITNYLKKIDSNALELWENYQNLDDLPKGEERSNIARNITRLLGLLGNQLKDLQTEFSPYLKFKAWK